MSNVIIVVFDIALAGWMLTALTDPDTDASPLRRWGYSMGFLFLLASAATRVLMMLLEVAP